MAVGQVFLLWIAVVSHCIGLESEQLVSYQSDWPVGDPKRCLDNAKIGKLNLDLFEVLPGIGWDNLVNKETSLVVSYNFSQCKLTDDRHYLLPNDVMTVPIKDSHVQTFAEVIEEWNEARSMTSDTVNVDVGLKVPFVSISGKFSYEHQQLKTTQMKHNAMTTRVQLRYQRYQVKLNMDPQLSLPFKDRLLKIGEKLYANQTEYARYLSQLLVREYGTHVLTSLTAGAALVKDDYLDRSFAQLTSDERSSILVAASASFFGAFHVDTSYSHKSESSSNSGYDKSVRQSYIYTFGGPKFKTNMEVDQWADGVDSNLVAMDRAGDPLYFFITPQTLPELSDFIVESVAKMVQEAIETYYEMNTVRGCTKLGEPNFSYSANFNDGNCKEVSTNLMFGGVYQKCTRPGGNPSCYSLSSQVNPKTGSFSCPESYKPVAVYTYYLSFFGLEASTSYWCAPVGPVQQSSGYLFGGLYGNGVINVLTGAMNCPAGFYPRSIFYDMFICISDDFEQHSGSSIPFGGFFTCNIGNPLAMDAYNTNDLKASNGNSLKSFLVGSGEEGYPKKCPDGFSQHLVAIKEGCAIHYCVRTGSLNSPNITTVKRPPFMRVPETFNMQNITFYKRKIVENEKSMENLTKAEHRSIQYSELPSSAIAGIVLGVLLGCAGIAVFIFVVVKKRLLRRTTLYRRLSEESAVLYGSDMST
ncbi:macrophage-expressed 1 protein [Biomphalaria glabrata]|nr:macrophage-expressed gene 1 protein-like [Biomphalaria glabrata]